MRPLGAPSAGPARSDSAPSSARRFGPAAALLCAAVAAYVVLSFRIAQTKIPWIDEGWNSAPVLSLLTGQGTGTPSLEPTGSWLFDELTGVRQYTYWIMPPVILVQAAWCKVFGFTLVAIRSVSIVWGVVCLLAWYAIVHKLTGYRLAASVTALLLGLDFTFQWGSADVRMDVMCAALDSAALACYVLFRERNLWRALWTSNVLAAACVFTHPNGVIAVLGLAFLVLHKDRRRLAWPHAVVCLPYLIFGAAWGLYALQQPVYFLAQLHANASVRGGERWLGVLSPLRAIRDEALLRHLSPYGLYPFWAGRVPKPLTLAPIFYWIACLVAVGFRAIRQERGVATLLWLTTIHLGFLTFFVGLKNTAYLPLVLPLYAAVTAIVLCNSLKQKLVFAPVFLFCSIGLVSLHVYSSWTKIRENGYGREYAPAVEYLKRNTRPGDVVAAASYFGMDLGYGNIVDDASLGRHSRIRPDFVVVDKWYRYLYEPELMRHDPLSVRYIRRVLESDFRQVFEAGQFRVYRRIDSSGRGTR